MTPPVFRTGLIGGPLTKSLSPRLFELISRRLGVRIEYALQGSSRSGLAAVLARAKRKGWRGFNVTIPFKESILPLLGRVDVQARGIGAVNAVSIEGGVLVGHNTDAWALRRALRETGARIRGARCAIWGAGGAARAAAWTLALLGASGVDVHGRTPERGGALVRAFAQRFPFVTFRSRGFAAPPARGVRVFVNVTPLGMYAPWPRAVRVPNVEGAVYCDFAYSPDGTTFTKGRPGPVIDGLDLLVWQGVRSAQLWTGRLLSRRQSAGVRHEISDRG